MEINGEGNFVLIGKNSRLLNSKIIINGSHNTIKIGANCRLCDTTLWIDDDYNEIAIDELTTIEGAGIAAMEGTNIHIGKNCMLSHHIEIRTGDSHSILRDGNRINKSSDIYIGNKVWICARVVILKGSHIPEGCVIGISSLVNKKLMDRNSIYVGNPIRKVTNDIEWTRERIK